MEKVASVCRRLLQVGQANFIGFSSNFSNKSYSCCAFWKDKSSAFFAYVILRKLLISLVDNMLTFLSFSNEG